MKRTFAVAVVTALLFSFQGSAVRAERPHHGRYETKWVNVFWHSRERVDRDTYRRVTWYAGAYDSGEEGGFWSDLYRSVEECEKREGRDRCTWVRRLSWWGVTGRGAFTIDGKLSSSHLEVSYKLYRTRHGEQERVGRFHVVAEATGDGDLTRGRNSYSFHQGCVVHHYNGRWASRQASATGTLALGDGEPWSLGETDDAAIGTSEDVSFEHVC